MSDKEDEFFAIIRNGCQSIVTELDAYLSKKVETTEQVVNRTYDLNKVEWIPKTGDKGDYEMAKAGADYQALLQDLKAHNGRMTIQGYYIWLFPNGDAVGRKKSFSK